MLDVPAKRASVYIRAFASESDVDPRIGRIDDSRAYGYEPVIKPLNDAATTTAAAAACGKPRRKCNDHKAAGCWCAWRCPGGVVSRGESVSGDIE